MPDRIIQSYNLNHLLPLFSMLKSPALEITRLTILVLILCGCNVKSTEHPSMSTKDTASNRDIGSQSSDATWDAGIVFAGEPTRISFPLNDPHVHTALDITEIHASCHCVTAHARDYVNARGDVSVAIQIRVAESKKEMPSSDGISLIVELTVLLESGEIIKRTVSLLLAGIQDK